MAALSKEASKRGARFRPVGIETLRSYKLRRGALELFAVGRWLVCSGNRGKERRRPDADAAAAIGEERRNKRPNLISRHAFEHVERADSDHRIGVRQVCARQSNIRR